MLDFETRQEIYRRRRRHVLRMKIGLGAGLILLVLLIVVKNAKTYKGLELDPSEFVSVKYQGFDGHGSAYTEINREKVIAGMEEAYSRYEKAWWPSDKKETLDSFRDFGMSLAARLEKEEELENGDEVDILLDYDESRAKALKISMKYEELPFTVENLEAGVKISKEELFGGMSLSVNGISPMITVIISNTSQDSFLKTVEYRQEDDREFFEKGDKLKIRAVYDKNKAVLARCDIDEADTVMEYTVPGDKRYVRSPDDLDEETLKRAIEIGKRCFTGANEYGLRIFTEAHLPYSWEGTGDYTFEWSEPRVISAYLETMRDEYRGDPKKLYNYLELAYEVRIEQANGVGCEAEGVVCFDQLTVDDEGRVDINEESARLFTASYKDSEIKKTIRDWFGDEYELKKLDLNGLKSE
ncbi:MAG: hypothetical protein IKR68_04605 [Lachnospiraceae bacterium]|nr:hypothetical protein [Lachnospiraceae bacterium]